MAEKLLRYYKYLSETNGLAGRIKLAVETKITSIAAALEPDSPENITKFKKAVEKITGKRAPEL